MNIESKDPHSQYVPGQPKIVATHWLVGFDFEERRVLGLVRHTFDKPGKTVLDTRELAIGRVYGLKENEIAYELGTSSDLLGTSLTLTVPDDLVVMIDYNASANAHGVQWMSAELAGGHPFVYTQGEAINARSYIPCQDTPSVKFTFSAAVVVPKALRGLIAASDHVERTVGGEKAVEEWKLPYPIPSYLIAFAVGDLVSEDLSDRTRVWTQPSMIAAAASEFRDIPKLMQAGEALFGEYPFGRYDVLVMPAAFPYGGMENPCLSFLTPALLAGDGSGMPTVAHELAHSWTGNLVTNADWDAFWLNEGWTVWAEFHIVEEAYGLDAAMLNLRLLKTEFDADCARFERDGDYGLTRLAHGHTEVNPDDVFSRVPYFKGAQFLRLVEQTVGSERFAAFVKKYLSTYRFKSITTVAFLDFASQELGHDVMEKIGARAWVYGTGLPENAPAIESPLIRAVEEVVASGKLPSPNVSWSTPQWQLYLELLPAGTSASFLGDLDALFGLSQIPNTEVRWSFLVLAIRSGYLAVLPDVEAFLHAQGRMKYLKPLYEALAGTAEGRKEAERIFADARHAYHPVAVATVTQSLSRTA